MNRIILLLFILVVNVCFGQTANELYKKGIKKYLKEDYVGAIDLLTKSLAKFSKNDKAYNVRGASKNVLGFQTGAIDDYNIALKLNPNIKHVLYNRGHAYLNNEEYACAIEDFDKVILQNPNDYLALFYRGEAKFNQGDYTDAIEDFKKSLNIKKRNSLSYLVIAHAEKEMGQTNNLHTYYDLLIKHNNKRTAYFAIAAINFETEEYYVALEYCNKYLEIKESSIGLLLRSEIKYILKDSIAAFDDMQKAILLNDNTYFMNSMIGILKFKMQKYSEAIEFLDKAIEQNPYNPEYYYRASSKHKINNIDEACKDLKKSIELGGEKAKELLEHICNSSE